MNRPRPFAALALAGLALAVAGCSHSHREDIVIVQPAPEPRPVSILVEVYDPISGFVWEDVAVRIVDSYQEWSGLTIGALDPADWRFTDGEGLVYFDEIDFALQDVGFQEDGNGNAVLFPGAPEDEAEVLLEIDGVGFTPIFVTVDLSWTEPDVFVSVPFS